MRIGVDFDGVIADRKNETIFFAKKYFGVDLNSSECTSWKANAKIGEGAYGKILLKALEFGPNIVNFEPTPHVGQALAYLMHQGHKVIVITTLSTPGSRIGWAKAFLHRHGIPYSHWTSITLPADEVGTRKREEYGVKKYQCERLGINTMIDDDIGNLKPLVESGRLLLLFDQPWNRDISVPKGVIRAFGWQDVLKKIVEFQQGNVPEQPARSRWFWLTGK